MDADAVQIFLSNPQQWKAPLPRDDADDLRASDIDIYVHSPYLMNLASPNNRVRIPSRKTLAQTVQAAAAVGQIRLARAYEQALAPHSITTGQVLVTSAREDEVQAIENKYDEFFHRDE